MFPSSSNPKFNVVVIASATGTPCEYNSYVLFAASLVPFVAPNFVAFFVTCLTLALLLKSSAGPWFSATALVPQLIQYGHLLTLMLADCAFFWTVSIILGLVFHDVISSWNDWVLPFPPYRVSGLDLGWCLYVFYVFLRAAYLAVALISPPRNGATSRRTLVWAFCLGNIGLIVRCFKYDAFRSLMDAIGPKSWRFCADAFWTQIAYAILASAAILMQVHFNWADNLVFYKLHRTLHQSSGLYDFCHSAHHRARVPTILDSGTISPAELILTDSTIPAILVLAPTFVVIGFEFMAVCGHWGAHASELGSFSFGRHHRVHHRLPSKNFGLANHYDRLFATEADYDRLSSATETEQN